MATPDPGHPTSRRRREPLVDLVARLSRGAVRAPGERGEDDLFACWEMRASATARDGGEVAIDGGARVERLDPATRRARTAHFAVGAGPAAVHRLARGGLDADAEGWSEVAGALSTRVGAARRAALGACRDVAGPPAALPAEPRLPIVVEVRARARIVQAGARAEPLVAVDAGVRLVAQSPRRGRALAEVTLGGLKHAPAALRRAAAAVLDVATASPSPRPGRASSEGRRLAGIGPVVLLPQAAAWWVHEMSHAAFEEVEIGARDEDRGLRIVEDPASAPWPAGFEVDDMGVRTTACVLWGGPGAAVPGPGHRRRSSVRDEAFPVPAVTRLETGGGPNQSIGALAPGSLAVTSVDAGRLDPPAGVVLLHADGLALVEDGAFRAVPGEGVVTVGVAEGWQGVSVVADGPPPTLVSALCTRQGRSTPVMVGAPTLLLDSVRFTAE